MATPIKDQHLTTRRGLRLRNAAGFAITSKHPTCFVLFSKLPDELQLLIWEYAVLNLRRRIAKVDYHRGSSIHIRTPRSIPGLSTVCHDARAMFLKSYEFGFTYLFLKPNFFNPSLDIAYLTTLVPASLPFGPDGPKIRNLAIAPFNHGLGLPGALDLLVIALYTIYEHATHLYVVLPIPGQGRHVDNFGAVVKYALGEAFRSFRVSNPGSGTKEGLKITYVQEAQLEKMGELK